MAPSGRVIVTGSGVASVMLRKRASLCRSSSSARLRSLISWMLVTKYRGAPPVSRTSVLERSAQTTRPSRRM